jgi:hypothetical protein
MAVVELRLFAPDAIGVPAKQVQLAGIGSTSASHRCGMEATPPYAATIEPTHARRC